VLLQCCRLVGEGDDAGGERLRLDEMERGVRVAEETLATAEDDRIDEQAVEVDQVVT